MPVLTVGTCYQHCAFLVAMLGYLVRGTVTAGLARKAQLVAGSLVREILGLSVFGGGDGYWREARRSESQVSNRVRICLDR